MGMTRAVGLGFLLLLVVSHATEQSEGTTEKPVTEAERKQAFLDKLSGNQHYIGAKTERLNNVSVGDKLYFFVDGSHWNVDWTATSRHFLVDDLKPTSISSLFSVQIVPMKPGKQVFQLRSRNRYELRRKVEFTASQGSLYFLSLHQAISITSSINTKSTFCILDPELNNSQIIIGSSSALTTSEDQAPYSETGRNYQSWKCIHATPTASGSHNLNIKSKKNSSSRLFSVYSVDIQAQ